MSTGDWKKRSNPEGSGGMISPNVTTRGIAIYFPLAADVT
jgi:hypothetical protein